MSLQVQILTPTGEILNTTATQATATGFLGEFGIRPGHLPFLTSLKIGPAYFEQGNRTLYFALGEGFAEIYEDKITLFVETAEEAPKIDEERAQDALERSSKKLKNFRGPIDSAEFLNLSQAKSRAENRLYIATFKEEYIIPGQS